MLAYKCAAFTIAVTDLNMDEIADKLFDEMNGSFADRNDCHYSGVHQFQVDLRSSILCEQMADTYLWRRMASAREKKVKCC